MLNARTLIVLGVIMLFLLGLGYFFYGIQPTFASDGEVSFVIAKGESFRQIGARLSQESLIRSITVFKLYAFLTGTAQDFKPGVYNLSASMSIPHMVQLLSTSGANEVAVTLPEGSTLKDMNVLLAQAGVLEENSLEHFSVEELTGDYPFLMYMSSLEGFLFPDTYRFERSSTPERVVRRLLDTFEEKAWPELRDQTNWYDTLILASFLEREVPEYDDRQVVAGILLKRLAAGMPLQVDATLTYVKCHGEFLGCKSLGVSTEDTTTLSSPYNLYQRVGWTPTPIANPGLEALQAARDPVASPYWYYLSASETGETIFSRTLEEHNINRHTYL